MKKEILKDYLLNDKVDIDKLLDDFYGYVYIIVKNGISIYLTDEDIEEIISDVFIAVWNNSKEISNTIDIKAYLAGTAKNIIKNKYRKNEINFSISEYEEKIVDNSNLEKQAEENEQNIIIKNTLKTLKKKNILYLLCFTMKIEQQKKLQNT
uniref:sigma-70 family RNA polymerase sigma factor n=1 Tax=Candidatus Merdicola sp. TaxID=3085652 RepID=UPI003FEDCD30